MTFREALAATVAALSAANLEATGITYEVLVGDENLAANGAPPRIIIVPGSSTPLSASQQYGRGPRAVAGDRHEFTAVLWSAAAPGDVSAGADYSAVSTMRAIFIATMRAAFGATFQVGPGAWSSVEGESLTQEGRQFAQTFTLDLSFVEATPTTAVVTNTVTNLGISEPGTNFVNPTS